MVYGRRWEIPTCPIWSERASAPIVSTVSASCLGVISTDSGGCEQKTWERKREREKERGEGMDGSSTLLLQLELRLEVLRFTLRFELQIEESWKENSALPYRGLKSDGKTKNRRHSRMSCIWKALGAVRKFTHVRSHEKRKSEQHWLWNRSTSYLRSSREGAHSIHGEDKEDELRILP